MDLFFEELSTGSISVENFQVCDLVCIHLSALQKRLKEVDDFAVFIDAAVSTAAAVCALSVETNRCRHTVRICPD